jgi:hypothetical protein
MPTAKENLILPHIRVAVSKQFAASCFVAVPGMTAMEMEVQVAARSHSFLGNLPIISCQPQP